MEIFQGIVIGVFSGLTLGGLAYIRDRFVRCDQIKYIRELIIKERERIYSANDLPGPPFRVTKNVLRLTLYKGMRRNLSATLEGRASQLSFDEKASITSQCEPIDWLLAQIRQNQTPPVQMYTKMFSEWENCAWLNLPTYEGEIPEQ